jgi:uncharacterized protein
MQPVSVKERIISLDVLRGIAVLGILIMNIQSFSMPTAAYINPDAYGELTGANRWIWILSHMLASEKFMSIFSILFGAGILIFSERAIAKGKNSATLHYKRMWWLLLFGLLHAYLLWYGDILFKYSICGMLVFLFRNMRPSRLVWISLGFFLVPVCITLFFGWSIPYWPEESLRQTMHSWKPPDEVLEHTLELMRGTWVEQMQERVPTSLFMQTSFFLMETFWRITSMMLLGMALYKWNVLSAARGSTFYTRMVFIGFTVGPGLSALGVIMNFKHNWSLEYSMFQGSLFNYFGSVALALGYTGLIMLICRSGRNRVFTRIFASAGRMAFTNYLLMTLICTTLFYGHGFGIYGRVERVTQALIIPGIWILLLWVSSLWLKRFRYGPLEWLWRTLTYGSLA